MMYHFFVAFCFIVGLHETSILSSGKSSTDLRDLPSNFFGESKRKENNQIVIVKPWRLPTEKEIKQLCKPLSQGEYGAHFLHFLRDKTTEKHDWLRPCEIIINAIEQYAHGTSEQPQFVASPARRIIATLREPKPSSDMQTWYNTKVLPDLKKMYNELQKLKPQISLFNALTASGKVKRAFVQLIEEFLKLKPILERLVQKSNIAAERKKSAGVIQDAQKIRDEAAQEHDKSLALQKQWHALQNQGTDQ